MTPPNEKCQEMLFHRTAHPGNGKQLYLWTLILHFLQCNILKQRLNSILDLKDWMILGPDSVKYIKFCIVSICGSNETLYQRFDNG